MTENKKRIWEKTVERAKGTELTPFFEGKLYGFRRGAQVLSKYADAEQAEAFLDGWLDCNSVEEPTARTEQEIVEQTEELAVWLLSWGFNHQPATSKPMRDSTHPFAQRCWAAACHIQEMLTGTDPENAVAELDENPEKAEASMAQVLDVNASNAESLAQLKDFVTRTRHWKEGGTDRHTALLALKKLGA